MTIGKTLLTEAIALLALSLCPWTAHAQAGQGQAMPVWRAAPQAASQLGDSAAVGTWRVQKPGWARSISQITQQGRSSVTVVQTWGSKPRADGTFPMLMMTVTDMQSALSPATPDGVMDAIESSTLRGKTGLVIASREYSLLHGLPAAREYWKYTVKGSGQLHGFFYTTVQGLSFVGVTGMDAAPSHVLTLPTLEAAALTLQSTSQAAQAAPAVPLSAPLPAPAHPADFLGSETAALGYKVRPPQGYTPVSMSVAGMQMAAWVGAKHADGQAPILMVARTQAPAPGAAGTQPPAQAALLGLLDAVEKHYQNVQNNPARAGAINGIPAVYVYWTGIVPASGARMHGFGYGAQDGGTLLLFIARDSEPTQSAALPVLDASVMTFHH
jgi:hypothetical protein